MTKSDLKTGHIVTYRNGNKRKVLLNSCLGGDILVAQDGWMPLNRFNEDLTNKDNHNFDIVKVEEPLLTCHLVQEDPSTKTIWERKEKKQYTYAQLKEIIGEDFEIVE